jgi:hypothetical protein
MTPAGLTGSPSEDIPRLCCEHRKELEFFCTVCEVVICSKCVTGAHRGHTVDDVDDAYTHFKVRMYTGITSPGYYSIHTRYFPSKYNGVSVSCSIISIINRHILVLTQQRSFWQYNIHSESYGAIGKSRQLSTKFIPSDIIHENMLIIIEHLIGNKTMLFNNHW